MTQRICSFLPSATEILYALGLGESVTGVTYKCDYPPEAREKTVLVRSRLPQVSSPADTDRLVRDFLARGESLYEVNAEKLQQMDPDLILTQDLCHVCAASPGDLASVLSALPSSPQVLTLHPTRLLDVWQDIRDVGHATGRDAHAAHLVAELERRVSAVGRRVADRSRPKVVCLEWLDPPFIAGHWVPEMVACAGGRDALGRTGEAGFRIAWESVARSQPDVLVLMPCGYGLEQTLREAAAMQPPEGWDELPAVRQGRVFAVDASSYFSRPGPRLATGVEILERILHPDIVTALVPAASVAPCRRTGSTGRQREGPK